MPSNSAKPPAGPPEFPKEFVSKHCTQVLEARSWRRNFKLPPNPEEDEMHAECAFVTAGFGLKCENCHLFICEGPGGREADKFTPAIRQYYRDLKVWEKEEEKRQKKIVTANQAKGAFI